MNNKKPDKKKQLYTAPEAKGLDSHPFLNGGMDPSCADGSGASIAGGCGNGNNAASQCDNGPGIF